MYGLEEYLRSNAAPTGVEGSRFELVIFKELPLTVYIHPINRDGKTYDMVINDNSTLPKIFVDQMWELLNSKLNQ